METLISVAVWFLYSVRKKTTVSKKKNNCECKVRMFSEFWLKASAADCMYLI